MQDLPLYLILVLYIVLDRWEKHVFNRYIASLRLDLDKKPDTPPVLPLSENVKFLRTNLHRQLVHSKIHPKLVCHQAGVTEDELHNAKCGQPLDEATAARLAEWLRNHMTKK